MGKRLKPLLTAVVSLLGFLALIFIIYLVRYGVVMDRTLLQYYLVFGAVGALSLAIKWYGFGAIFLGGAVAGLIVDCVVSLREGPRPTMQGGIYNILIVLLGAAIGVLVQISASRAKKRAV